MDNLIENLEKLHTTPLGARRIKNNLALETDDVARWCQEAVRQSDIIIGQGKNYYVYRGGIVITINVHSYTIITAHKINAKVHVMQEMDYKCLPEFLYQAIYIPAGEARPSRSIINEPEIFVYIKDFGTQPGDLGVVAEQNGQIIGAAWTRIISAYGHIDEETPELAISLFPEFRGYGIGTKLMKKLFAVLRNGGYKQTSLSVQKDNPAVRFYQRLGYKITREKPDHAGHEDCIMVKKLSEVLIRNITKRKKEFLPLLLLGDEQESSIDKYLERGELFALYDGDLKSVCVVTDEGGGVLEIQNLATDVRYQQRGYASELINYIGEHYKNRYDKIILGTGDVPGTLAFYKHCGFAETHRVADYFTRHYDFPIIEEGILLKDKVYLEKNLERAAASDNGDAS